MLQAPVLGGSPCASRRGRDADVRPTAVLLLQLYECTKSLHARYTHIIQILNYGSPMFPDATSHNLDRFLAAGQPTTPCLTKSRTLLTFNPSKISRVCSPALRYGPPAGCVADVRERVGAGAGVHPSSSLALGLLSAA